MALGHFAEQYLNGGNPQEGGGNVVVNAVQSDGVIALDKTWNDLYNCLHNGGRTVTIAERGNPDEEGYSLHLEPITIDLQTTTEYNDDYSEWWTVWVADMAQDGAFATFKSRSRDGVLTMVMPT